MQTAKLKVGASGTALTQILKGTVSVSTFTCTANGTSLVTFQINGLTSADLILVNPATSLNSGLHAAAYYSAASIANMAFSNMSTAQQILGTTTFLYATIRS